MVLFGLRDIGSVNACLPVITILKDRGIPVSVYAEGAALDRLAGSLALITKQDINSLLESIVPLLVIVTPSTPTPGAIVPIELTDRAKQKNIPVIFVEDNWSGHSSQSWNFMPDAVCVVDDFARKLVKKSWPYYPESNIHVTGAPVFDKFVSVDRESAKHKLRVALNLNENWPVIFFAGEVWGMTEAVPMFIKALNNLGVPIYLILRDHPNIVLSDAPDEFKRIYSKYSESLKNLKIGEIIDSRKLTSEEVNSGADVVVGICSTMLVEACYMRKPVLSIWTPEIGQALFEVAQNTFAEMPITNLGSALKAESVDEIKSCLRQILDGNTISMAKAQEEHFKTDGLSGRRLAEAILKYYA